MMVCSPTNPSAYLLDTIEPRLFGHRGTLYGIHQTFGDTEFILITSTVPGSSWVPVASTWEDTGLPVLVRVYGGDEAEDGTWALCRGTDCLDVEVIPYTNDYSARSAGLVDATRLGRAKVVFVGVGSVGGPIAHLLGRAGVGEVVLIDAEFVGLENLTRSQFDVTDLGERKVHAVARKLLLANPGMRVQAIVGEIPAVFERPTAFKDADLIVGAASNTSNFMLAERFHRTTPILFPGMHAKAASGELFASRGKAHAEDACFACFRAKRGVEGGVAPETGRTWNYSAPGQELAAEPGLGPDIGHVVAVTASVAVNMLAGTAERVIDPRRPLFITVNRAGALPGFEQSFSSRWVPVPRDPECPNHAETEPVDAEELRSLLSAIPEAE